MYDFTPEEFKLRLRSLQASLGKQKVDLAILNQNSDLYYYTGSVQPLYLLVPAQGEALALARKSGQRVQDEAPWLRFELFQNTRDLAAILSNSKFNGAKRLGLTVDTTAYATVLRWQQLLVGAEVVDITWSVRTLRMKKSTAEIVILAKAGEIIAGIPEIVAQAFQPGMTELEVSVIVESYLRRSGHGGLVRCRREGIEMGLGVCSAGVNLLAGTKFDGVCAGTGISAAVPYGASEKPIAQYEPVLLDYALNFAGYHVDQTRMFSWGKPCREVEEAYQAMLGIERFVITEMKPGVIWSEIYEKALELATKLGYHNEFMGIGNEKVRFIGHGVGLELDEPPHLAPKMDFPLQTGMAVAIEPKVALAGVGVVGIEDTFIVKDSGCELLTLASPEYLIVD